MSESDAQPLFGRREMDPYHLKREDDLNEQVQALIKEGKIKDISRIILKLEDEKAVALNALYFARNIDPLTKAVSKANFKEALAESARLFENRNIPFSAIYIDLEKFKEINDLLGHQKGDEALIETVRIIRNSIRPTDLVVMRNDENDTEVSKQDTVENATSREVARLGGDEFMVLLEGTDEIEAKLVMERILKNLEIEKGKSQQDSVVQRININYGIMQWQEGMDVDGFMEKADKRMYEQKRGTTQTNEE